MCLLPFDFCVFKYLNNNSFHVNKILYLVINNIY